MRTLLLTIVSIFLFANIAEAAIFSQTIEVKGQGSITVKIQNAVRGYNSQIFKAVWKTPGKSEAKRTYIMFARGRKLPSRFNYITVQNERDQLVKIDDNERELIVSAMAQLDRSNEHSSLVTEFMNLLAETPNVQSDYFRSRGQINQLMDDGIFWAAGWYTKDRSKRYMLAPVGDSKTKCAGRKGSKCGSPKYSREALNHDLCHRIEDANLSSPCRDEFGSAALAPTSRHIERVLF